MEEGGMKITRTQIITGCVLVGALCSFAYYEYTKYVDAKLVDTVKNEFNKLHFKTDGSIVYQQISANHNCKWSQLTVVYSSNNAPKDICASFLSSLPPLKWQPQHDQRQTDFCVDRSNTKTLFAHNPPETVFLELWAYPNSAARTNTFIPVNPSAELAIQKNAIKHGENFYYIHLRYQTPEDREEQGCNANEGVYDCACLDSTYEEDTLPELQKHADKSRNP